MHGSAMMYGMTEFHSLAAAIDGPAAPLRAPTHSGGGSTPGLRTSTSPCTRAWQARRTGVFSTARPRPSARLYDSKRLIEESWSPPASTEQAQVVHSPLPPQVVGQ